MSTALNGIASPPQTRSRPQYHYFYGSTDSETPGSPQMSENDTLLGESLVPTDNEEDSTQTRSRDFWQVLVTNGEHIPNGDSNTKGSLLDSYYDSYQQNNYQNEASLSEKLSEDQISTSCCRSNWNKSGIRSASQVTRIVVLLALMILMLALGLLLTPKANFSNGPTPPPQIHSPYPLVDRATYNDPASEIVNTTLFAPALLFTKGKVGLGSRTSSAICPVLRVPFPTGAFWTNLVTQPSSQSGLSHPIVAYPYAFKWSDSNLQASYPAIRRKEKGRSIRDVFQPDVSFGTHEDITRRHIMRFDALSVTTRFYTTSQGYWESYIVHGSPYITIKYSSATPVLEALSTFQRVMCPFDQAGNYYDGNEDLLIDGLSKQGNRRLKWGVCNPSIGSGNENFALLRGVQFLLQTQENMTWILFSSELIELEFDAVKKTKIVATNSFSGILRLALIPPTRDTSKSGQLRLSDSTGLKRLVYHAGVYPISGTVSWDFKSSTSPAAVLHNAVNMVAKETSLISTKTSSGASNVGIVGFKFETEFLNQNSNSNLQLLTLALPHHADLLQPETMLTDTDFDLEYNCIKGKMIPVVGSTWTYDEKLVSTMFDPVATDYNNTLNPNTARHILQNVEADLELLPPMDSFGIYSYAKRTARLAQLAHIAKVVNVALPSEVSQSLLNSATLKLHDSLLDLFFGNVNDELVYDIKFGGIVSKNGLRGVNEDYGNGRYDKHHFHYGYILYASAVLAQLNASFVGEYGDWVDSLMYDIGYHSNVDSGNVDAMFFPFSRHVSWYDGHSFATGLFSDVNGKSQDSSSEAVNGYYGAYLWSLVREPVGASSQTTNFLRLLLSMEMRGAETYWHLSPTSSKETSSNLVYGNSSVFESNYMVGKLGMLNVECSTPVSNELYLVHLKNLLPVTTITSELFSKEYVKGQYEHVMLRANVSGEWKGYAVCNHAIIDPVKAWKEAQELVSVELDEGISKSQVLYFVNSLLGSGNAPVSNITLREGDSIGQSKP
mmetsp:Transcript_9400/g.14530  ORF Transcript_9400/g.14530 Transcript_9400/m.14530 type:complete len:1006 (+) Transcript_9400:256-3273(+)|eukprot:CAMPEP_0178911834 /NCGR_PEP_ID=MMETSP0786-20121207/9919_1 /TAXON_ID=186022 /ORGANISM="Thalassionema frauenfeldii, Strain CCMP 1798" /LENGTH=1005 /DNA_ID=CAMNT_0020584333 /DNA_START=203 /DNA_END=3220 /DNA_ORIENTATION=-